MRDGTADFCCQTLSAAEESVDGPDSGLEFSARSSYVPMTLDGVRSRFSRRGAALNCAAHAPEIAQEELLREP
jgi:hypothetical protein